MNVNKLKKTLSVLLSAAGCSMIDYKKAEKLKNDGDYAAAQEMYIALGDYKDSAELANECGYQLAKAAYDSEDYETAAGLFDKLGSYKNSAELKLDCEDNLLSAKLVGKWVTGNVDIADVVQAVFDALSGSMDVAALARTTLPAKAVSPTGRFSPFCMSGTITTNPKKPYTTDGIPANSSTPGFIMRYNGLGQNLAKNTAAKIPIGTPTMIAPAVT